MRVLLPVGVDANDQNLLQGAPFYNAFYKRGKSIGKIPRRLEGAEIFAVLSSPSHVARLLEFLFSVDSFCCGDDAIGF